MINILVADDHVIFRIGLAHYVSDAKDIFVKDFAATGEEALEKSLNNMYDVILLDITLPDINGLEVLKNLINQKPNVKVLVLSVHPEEQYALRVLKAGAVGYLDKENAPHELITAIRKIAAGGKYLSPSFAEKLALGFSYNSAKPFHQSLTDREYQIMSMIVMGKRLSDIAKELTLSIKTVSSHRSHILEKLNISSNAELVRYAVDNHLIR